MTEGATMCAVDPAKRPATPSGYVPYVRLHQYQEAGQDATVSNALLNGPFICYSLLLKPLLGSWVKVAAWGEM